MHLVRDAFAALALLAAAGGAGAQVEIVSPAPDSVSVTIYRDLVALITETRTIELPADPVTLSFDGVVETLIPASAVVTDLGRAPAERNYDYDPLTAGGLLRKSVGKHVLLTSTLPGSGRVVQVQAVIEAAGPGGVTLRTPDGLTGWHCSGIPEGLTFEEIPEGLHPRPRLSIRLRGGTAGRRTIKLSYIAQGFAWSSDYVAHLDAAGGNFALTGWLTLRNFTNAGFKQAQVQVVAGRLNLLGDTQGGSSSFGDTADYYTEDDLQSARDAQVEMMQARQPVDELAQLRGCYPKPVDPDGERRFRRSVIAEDIGQLQEVVVTGLRASTPVATIVAETLADYHLYRLPWPTDLNARQTKQAVFLDRPRVRADYFYALHLDPRDTHASSDEEPLALPQVTLGFENTRAAGLGEALPKGVLRAFVREDAGDVFIGEARLADKAVGLPVELALGNALDLALNLDVVDGRDRQGAGPLDVDLQVRSAKSRPVTLEIRQAPAPGLAARVTDANHRTGRKYGDFAWRLRVPANGRDQLTYRLLLGPGDRPK